MFIGSRYVLIRFFSIFSYRFVVEDKFVEVQELVVDIEVFDVVFVVSVDDLELRLEVGEVFNLYWIIQVQEFWVLYFGDCIGVVFIEWIKRIQGNN